MLGTAGATGRQRNAAERALDRELEPLEHTLAEFGELRRVELARRLDARTGGPAATALRVSTLAETPLIAGSWRASEPCAARAAVYPQSR